MLAPGFDRVAVLREMIETATPIERVILAYDHLDVALEVAEQAILDRDPPSVNRELQRAQRLLAFLSIALDHERFEPAPLIDRLYLYCWRRLIEANTQLDVEAVREVRSHISQLGAAWRQAAGADAPATA